MAAPIQSVRGMNDVLPSDTPLWQWFEAEARALLGAYGYREIRLPVVEFTALFERGIGDTTDIVEKEMYTFEDRNGDSLSLRPEGTAGCVRAGLEHSLFHNQTQRLWYSGPMFRHERPQKGRYRQFHQLGVEAVGMPGPDIDAELILMTARLWKRIGLTNVRLELNTLGSAAARAQYREILVNYFSAHREVLDEDSKRRLQTNPLRILDSKNPALSGIIASAPSITDHLDQEAAEHFAALSEILNAAGVEFVVNSRLVRGLDYYTRTVFEWITDSLGAQGTVCAGGRYDGLIELAGGRPTAAVGFAMGVERLMALLQAQTAAPVDTHTPHIYLMPLASQCVQTALCFAEQLRDQVSNIRVQTHCGGGSIKSQMKRADQSGAQFGVLVGEDELNNGAVTVKPLRGDGAQQTLPMPKAIDWLKQAIIA
ncbi:MAG: histidine--tRNA ligase [Gammaproteobacteria bacterium]